VSAKGSEDSPALIIHQVRREPPLLSYEHVARGMAAWGADRAEYLFYFRRFVDDALPLDVRWLNGYRLLEWHFVRDQAHLSRSRAWRDFVAQFEESIRSALRKGQTAVGSLEEARALAAHAGLDKRSDDERLRDPQNAMERTLRVLEQMVIAVLNDSPAPDNAGIRFEHKPPTGS
jgi:hypothetical protein